MEGVEELIMQTKQVLKKDRDYSSCVAKINMRFWPMGETLKWSYMLGQNP